MRRDVFITGVGVVSPAGSGGAIDGWQSLVDGHLFVRPLHTIKSMKPTGICAGQLAHRAVPSGLEEHGRVCQIAVASADESLRCAGLSGGDTNGLDPRRSIVCIGTSKSYLDNNNLLDHRFPYEGYSSLKHLYPGFSASLDAAARLVSKRYGIAGGMHTAVAACATGTLAVIRGAQFIRDGDADWVVAGSSDASLHPLWLAAFERMGVLAQPHAERGPAWACRPFDRTRNGFVLGEGAGVLILESSKSVRQRGSQPIARIAGWAVGTDPTGLAKVTPDGGPLARVIGLACERSGYRTGQLSCVYAHGTGTISNDLAETRALRSILGNHVRKVPIVSLKGAMGHLLGAAGSVELAFAALSCQRRISPGTATLIEPDEELSDLRLPVTSFELDGNPILKTSLGFGGHLAAVVLASA